MIKQYLNNPYLLGAVIGLFAGAMLWGVTEIMTQSVHMHAGFQVYDGEEQLDFSGVEYMYVGQCDDMKDPERLQDRVHLHDQIGDVVHIHAPGITWKDLFWSLEKEELIDEIDRMIVDGEEVDVNLEKEIKAYERTIFLIENDMSVDQAWDDIMSLDHIIQVEQESTCDSDK